MSWLPWIGYCIIALQRRFGITFFSFSLSSYRSQLLQWNMLERQDWHQDGAVVKAETRISATGLIKLSIQITFP